MNHSENLEDTDHLTHDPEAEQTHAASEAGSVFAEYRRRQLNIFRERESSLDLDDSVI
jgi:hypothetical protein